MKKALSILALVAVLGAYSFLALGSGSSDSNTSVEPAETGTAVTETKNEKKTVHVGEKLVIDNFEIVYSSAEDYTNYSQYIAPKEGYKVIRLRFDCTNNGDRDFYISSFEFKCYADNNACDSFYGHGDDDELSATVSSGRGTSGSVYFEVPVNAASIEVEYETNFWNDNKAVFIVK